jgi:hypothetical protein
MLHYTCIACLVRYTKIHYHIHGNPPLVLILRYNESSPPHPPYYLNIQSNTILPCKQISSKLYTSISFSSQNAAYISLFLHACYILRSSHAFDFAGILITKEHTIPFSPASCNFLLLPPYTFLAPCASTLWACVLLKWQTKFHIHVKQAKWQTCSVQSASTEQTCLGMILFAMH